MLRIVGPALIVVGGTLAAIGIADFLIAFGKVGETPDKFWMAFVGFPILSAGLWLTGFAFLGGLARYSASELARSARAVVDSVGVLPTRLDCSTCGATNDGGARFCDSCGAPLGKQCEKCGDVNVASARFCDNCGAPL